MSVVTQIYGWQICAVVNPANGLSRDRGGREGLPPLPFLHPVHHSALPPHAILGSILKSYNDRGGREGLNHAPLQEASHLVAALLCPQQSCVKGSCPSPQNGRTTTGSAILDTDCTVFVNTHTSPSATYRPSASPSSRFCFWSSGTQPGGSQTPVGS